MTSARDMRRFWQLADAGLIAPPTDSENQELQGLLAGNRQLQRQYLRFSRMHADLKLVANARRALERARASLPGELDPGVAPVALPGLESQPGLAVDSTLPSPTPLLGFLGNSLSWSNSTVWLSALTLVVSFYGIFGLLIWSIDRSRRELVAELAEAHAVASSEAQREQVVESPDCRWEADGSPRQVARAGHGLVRRYRLAAGLAEIVLNKGTKVLLEGPAVFEVRSDNAAFLEYGKLVAQVPPPAVGFELATPAMEIVDLGTEFGVEVDRRGHAEMHMFTGQAEVRPLFVAQAGEVGRRRLVAGQAVRVSVGGDLETADVKPHNFARQIADRTNAVATDAAPHAAVDSGSAALIMQARPLLYLSMDAIDDQDHLLDSAAGGHHANLHRSVASREPLSPGVAGTALRLGGANVRDFAALAAYPPSRTGQLSVVAWVLAVDRTNLATIAGNWGDGGPKLDDPHGQFLFCIREGNLSAEVTQVKGVNLVLNEPEMFPVSRWQHVAFVVEVPRLRIYRGGVEVASAPCDEILKEIDLPMLGLGAKILGSSEEPSPNTAGYWNGMIDEFAVFDRALSAEFIGKLARRGKTK